MIIDGQADFRRLLEQHVTTHWDDAVVSSYDPTESGHLPDEFSGASNDVVLLGDEQGDRDARVTLRQFLGTPGFPAVVYFGDGAATEAAEIGASAVMRRSGIRHATLIAHIDNIMRSKHRAASNVSLPLSAEKSCLNMKRVS